ncbi:PREDICTED: centrosomin isoform X2 [Polistes canadensis]|uniref:centrosomin isoform X2 n=1 Tax=Polistes canadensis TaxID=91411 RepID=UPI000718DCC5|nr:PREDICTED: centrosomin isoform X2 [Polistes canadensis]
MLSKTHQRKMFLGGYVYGNKSQNNQPSSARGSIWGSAYSPFRNTNMPLQDITMGTTLPLANGTNSKSSEKNFPVSGVVEGVPGMASAGVGRTMKEYEDQLGALKKENFNLKLRIYFLEERMGITSADEGAIKKNIELKVEVESLRKELAEKQELLSQAAKAFELIEEQKEVSSRNQTQYEQSLEKERERIVQLEKELEEYRERATDASIFYKEAFGVTPEKALENEEKLHQMEELVASLEAEVRQISGSLEEEREWAQELESERDQFRDRLEAEIQMRENLATERLRDIDELRERVRELEDQVFKKDTIVQQYKNEINEKDRVLKEKNTLLEEKCRAYEEICSVSDRRKRQIDQLRTSVKARDDALTDLNNKHRTLLSQFENGYTKRSPVSSPSTVNPFIESVSPRMAQKLTCLQGSTNNDSAAFDREANKERLIKVKSPTIMMTSMDEKETKDLAKELQEKELELKRREEEKKQLILKLCNVQKQVEVTDQKFKKMEGEHLKAVKMIQGFMERQQQLEDRIAKKERKIEELEAELNRSSGYEDVKARRRDGSAKKEYSVEITENPEHDDNSNQQRFEEMEAKINDLRDQIETIKAEKHRLEKQIQVESEELQERLNDKDQRIEFLEIEKNTMKEELQDKITELDKLKQATVEIPAKESFESSEHTKLIQELNLRNAEIAEKNQKIEQLSKELQVKTHNLQKLVNTELWSKNKEIAKLHNHMTANNQLDRSRSKTDIPQESASTHFATLSKELNDIGIKVSFINEVIQLNYVNGNESIDVKTMTEYIQTLVEKKNELEKEVDYLNWLKLVTRPDIAAEIDECENESERTKRYCELLRAHLKNLVKLMKDILKNANHLDAIHHDHNQIVLEVLLSSNIFSDDFTQVLEKMTKHNVIVGNNKNVIENNEKIDNAVKKCYSENILDLPKNHMTTQSDSEAFSEPDRMVSMARIGLQETQHKSINRSRFSKHTKTFSDSEDSIDYIPYHKTYQDDLHDLDANRHIQELKETNNLLYSELSALKNDLTTKVSYDVIFDEKLVPLILKLEKSQKVCERLQSSLDKRIHECHALRKESKQNSIRKAQLEKKITDVESMVAEMTKQKTELLQYKENTEKKTAEMLMVLKRENDRLRSKIRTMEEDNETAKVKISALTKELDHLTLLHSQILVENTKLTNEKLRLEQEVRKTDNRYDMSVRLLQDKFSKEISDLNQINDSHRTRVEELEATNKELRRHLAVCEACDSAPSSSGISSIPTDSTLKQTCDEIIQEYQNYNASQYWQPINYQNLGGRSKSSCSPDLGIESDATVNTIRPLQDTLKITESMTNLLSDEDNSNRNAAAREVDSDSPLPIEGLDEIEALKQENETLKRRLMKTRRALEDTFQHLSTSNKNKKNVEKAITKQLMITKNILKKTRTYDEPFDN